MTDNALFLLPALRRARDLIDREYAEPLAAQVAGVGAPTCHGPDSPL
jgi:hypothetical protein